MALEVSLRPGRPFGPLVWALEERGCIVTVVPGPGRAAPRLRLVFPEDEYLEKQCRAILADWRTDSAV